ncbi:MAG: FAD-binding protein [Deltaproteobacteria bacterium]|nr:FAD-binding protein [Deltaproteobacteria bacterium]
MPRELETDCLIIGSGVAGLSAAIALADFGVDTLVVSSAPSVTQTNTLQAQGGIIFKSSSGSPERLVADILEAGCHFNYLPAACQLAQEGPQLVEKVLIHKVGVAFDKNGNGYDLTREAAHSENRILHRGDETGKAIEQSMADYCSGMKNIRFLAKMTAVNLLMSSFHCQDHSIRHEPARCIGAFVFDQESNQVFPIFAKHTVLATGGIGQLYLHNTNSPYARGDGIALAYRAGCRLENLEYIQFHPTTFFHPQSKRFLISESLRGEGAILINQKGERFLPKYLQHYAVPELAPRDKVAWAINQEMLSEGASCVYLDITRKPAGWIQERFPFVYSTCKKYGTDITKDPIPVVPAAHYHCGGVWTDLDGRTSVSNLWAVGETACTGLHGANRLASTSLLEGLVWGTHAGEGIGKDLGSGSKWVRPQIEEWINETAQVDPGFLSQDWLTLKQTMWNYVGLIKTDARLERAKGILTELAGGIDSFYRNAVLSDELIGLRHATLVALRIVDACQRNHRSKGCYFREELEI